LRSKLWPADTFVDFDHSLNAAIKRLRDALGESAETPIFVETVARRGTVSLLRSMVIPLPARSWPFRSEEVIFLASLGHHRLPLSARDCRSSMGTVAASITAHGGH
jgi:hypothetical protein